MRKLLLGIMLLVGGSVLASPVSADDSAEPATVQPTALALQFGALETVRDISLSPDGSRIAVIAPQRDETSHLLVMSATDNAAPPQRILEANGNPMHLGYCNWANDHRILCQTFGEERIERTMVSFSNMVAIDATGGNLRQLSRRRSGFETYIDGRGGTVVDLLPEDPQHILMSRVYVPEERTTTRTGSNYGTEGVGVDAVDIDTGQFRHVIAARRDASYYVSDGNGHVRIMALALTGSGDYLTGDSRLLVRPAVGDGWSRLVQVAPANSEEFTPAAVDAVTNRAIGYQKINGRIHVVAVALDGSGKTDILFSHPEVDIDNIIYAGNRHQVVGASYVTDRRNIIITDGPLRQMTNALSRALNNQQVIIADESNDGSAYLVLATSDINPGTYYLFRPALRQLNPLLDLRPQLNGLTLSAQHAVHYPAADGTEIPAYLTLPPGRDSVQGLPAIVMPHGGPSARDEWGFDWLAQFFAQSGFAVIQPNFRGSAGYGDQWYIDNGFQSWRTSVGDVTDAGRWLVTQGADPAKLSIVGWSYGGYAALQSGVLAPDLFKSIVAIAPVTDLSALRAQALRFTNGRLVQDFIGSGPHIEQGSPARNAARITAPVLLFHGSDDTNVDIDQSQRMRRALDSAHRPVELIEYPGLSHGLDSATARADMLTRIAAFLPH